MPEKYNIQIVPKTIEGEVVPKVTTWEDVKQSWGEVGKAWNKGLEDLKKTLEEAKAKQESHTYRVEGIITQEWQGTDDYGGWQVQILDKNREDIIYQIWQKMNESQELDAYNAAKVRVTIELIED